MRRAGHHGADARRRWDEAEARRRRRFEDDTCWHRTTRAARACLLALLGVFFGVVVFAFWASELLYYTQPMWSSHDQARDVGENLIAAVEEAKEELLKLAAPASAWWMRWQPTSTAGTPVTELDIAAFQREVLNFIPDSLEGLTRTTTAAVPPSEQGDKLLDEDPLAFVRREAEKRERARMRARTSELAFETNETLRNARRARRGVRRPVRDDAALGKWDDGTILKRTGSRKATKGKPCKSNADCSDRQLCVRKHTASTNGACTCPVMYSGGDPGKCNARPKDLPLWCPLHILSAELTRVAAKKGEGLLGSRLIEDSIDLPKKADWSSCAVVGSGPSLRKYALGEEIDRHTAILRFNEAPVRGFTNMVGSRTTLRIQNIDHCGYSEGRNELCLHYSSTPTHTCKESWWRRGKCNVISASNRLERYVHWHWGLARMAKSTSEEHSKKLSAGFFGIALAMHLCARVTVYGFGQADTGHYFNKERKNKGTMVSKRKFDDRHSWEYERKCLTLLKRKARVLPVMVRS